MAAVYPDQPVSAAEPRAARDWASGSQRVAMMRADCPLCAAPGGEVLAQCSDFRVIWPDEPDHPGLLRVIWNDHVAEMSELAADDRGRLMAAVFELESLMRRILEPDKINLASLGNMVAHLHWHVIPRWRDDRQFPASVWTAPVDADATGTRAAAASARLAKIRERQPALHQAVRAAFGAASDELPAKIG